MCVFNEELIIKELENENDFLSVFKVFREYPYNELWPDEEILQEFRTIKQKGKVAGCYYIDKCVGIVTFYDIVEGEHPVKYNKDKKVMYFSDIAVLPEWRNKGIATKLLYYMINFAESNLYDIIYMRTMQPDKSMSYKLVVKNGFKVIEGVTEDKEMLRVNGESKEDTRIFLEYLV